MKRIKKIFTIETSEEVMERFERLLGLFHHNSNFGHSGIFGMPLDGDGPDHFSVDPKPNYAKEIELISDVGYELELANSKGYSGSDLKDKNTRWEVKNNTLLNNGLVVKRKY